MSSQSGIPSGGGNVYTPWQELIRGFVHVLLAHGQKIADLDFFLKNKRLIHSQSLGKYFSWQCFKEESANSQCQTISEDKWHINVTW